MKTVFINCSPKKKFCASAYFISLGRMFTRGEKVTERLLTGTDHERILKQTEDADNVVFALPLYVDGVPSHVLSFMERMEAHCRRENRHFNVYCIANNGFIEGRQCEPLMQVFEHFCTRSGLNWCGGTGIGGGVMLNVTRIGLIVEAALLAVSMLLSGIQSGNFFPVDSMCDFAVNILILLFLSLGVLFYLAGMGNAMGYGRAFGKKYTRILVPSFLFIIFADIFFIIVSLVRGGLFRGWLARKQLPEQR